ncbi:MAG: CBS domain-containing protein [Bacteroidales bacterium]|nr:CBS domain-containing protein [Bacteroidales bacterium]
MKITDILKQRGQTVFTVSVDTSAIDAVGIMDKQKVGAVIVLDKKENVAGILSERDVLYKCYNSGKKLEEQTVDNLMTSVDDILVGQLDSTARDLMNVMLYRRIRHMPIIEEGKIVGMLSVEDIMKMMLDSYENESHQLREYIKNPFGVHIYGDK